MIAWCEGRIVRRTLSLGDDAVIVQTLETFGDGEWSVDSTTIHEDDMADGRSGKAKSLKEAKQLADRHDRELRKTWAAENGAEW